MPPTALAEETTAAPAAQPAPPVKSAASKRGRVPLPEPTKPIRINWMYGIGVVAVHILACLAFHPWNFSWTGVVLSTLTCPVFGMLGITLCYHRLLTHQGLTLPKWLEHFFAILGVCTLQDTPARWVAIHRMHHKHSDEQPDPHTPMVSFLWAHMGWLFITHRDHSAVRFYEQYAKDVLRDKFYLRLEHNLMWFWVYWIHAALYYAVGLGAGWLMTGTLAGGLQFAASVLVWGVFVRTIIIWHGTWMVNSVTHTWGYRNYQTDDDSRNEWVTAILAYGEGWHNNHHADQRSAIHGHKWWEFDMTYQVIRVLEMLGLAKDVVRPRAWTEKLAADQAAE